MSTPSSARSSGRNVSQRPSTPDRPRPSITRANSSAVAPKSTYLRDRLQARRAQNTPAPLAFDLRSTSLSSTKSAEMASPKSASSDEFADFTLTEEQIAPVSPVRRRRPSDTGISQSKTNRDLTDEIAKLKDANMTTNMRVQLLKQSNTDLQHALTREKERVEQLEPLEDENIELRDENDDLRHKMQAMEDELERYKHENEKLQKTNQEWLVLHDDCTSHLAEQESAVQEAVETIFALETDKSKLAVEIRSLLDRVTALEDGSRAGMLVDGSTRCPSRVYSIDESRPSTSHFDSDYYSQPASPHVKPSGDSTFSMTPSERSKRFLNLTEDRRRSAQDLIKRMSAASLKALSIKSPSPAPEVPQVPAIYQQHVPRIADQVTLDHPAKTPKRYRDRRLPQQPLLDALEVSPSLSDPTTPTSPPRSSSGLRGFYRLDISSEARPSSSHKSNSPITGRPRSRQPSGAETSPRVPSRVSSRVAHTSSSNEQIEYRSPRKPRQRRQSEPTIEGAEAKTEAEPGFEVWASSSMPPPPIPPTRSQRTSLVSSSDLTTEVDVDDKDRWWRSVGRLNQPQLPQRANSLAAPNLLSLSPLRPPVSPTLTRSQSHVGQHPASRPDLLIRVMKTPTKERDLNGVRRSRTQPNTPGAIPYQEKEDFLFNGAEDEDTFLRKAKAIIGRR